MLSGVVLAFAGQAVLLATPIGSRTMGSSQLLAGILLIGGMLLFGATSRAARDFHARFDFPMRVRREVAGPWFSPWRGTIIAAGIALAAIILFAAYGETPIVILLWIVGMAALLAVQYLRDPLAMPTEWRAEAPYLGALGLVLVLALIARTYRLTTLPYNFDGDFASFGLEARALITGVQPHIFAFGWGPAPMLGEVPAALTMKLFGDNLAGMNASGVIAGLLSIVGVYLLGRDLYHRRLGVIAAALLAASYAHLAASREVHYMEPVAVVVFALYFFLLGVREQRGWAIVASGFLVAMCTMYFPARIVFPIIAAILVFLAFCHRHALVKRAGWLALFLLAFVVALGPMLVVFSRSFQDLLTHTQNVFILHPNVVRHMQGVYQVNSIPAMLLEQARRTAFMFHYYGDSGTQFGFRRPFLDPITAPLLTLGFGIAMFRWRKLVSFVSIIWIILGMILGCFVEENPPYWTRLMILLPPAALLAGLALNHLYETALNAIPKRMAAGRVAITVALGAILLFIGIQNWNTYVQVESSYANGPSRFARYMAAQPLQTKAYIVSSAGWTYKLREFQFLIPSYLAGDLTPYQVQTGVIRVGSPTLLILTPEQTELLTKLPDLYPGGTLTAFPDNAPGSVAFYAYELPR